MTLTTPPAEIGMHLENVDTPALLIDLDEHTAQLCRKFDLEDKLELRPGNLNPLDLNIAITLRELSKYPEVLLMDRPEDYLGHSNFNLFVEVFKDLLSSGIAVVVLSFDKVLIETFANRKIMISNGTLKA